jgi:hypothetical protein
MNYSEHSDVFVVSDRVNKIISEHSDVFVVSDRVNKIISEHSDVFVVSDRVNKMNINGRKQIYPIAPQRAVSG